MLLCGRSVPVSIAGRSPEACLAEQGEQFFDELKRYVGFGPEDEATLRGMLPLVRPHFERIADDFYAHALDHAGSRQVITGGMAQVMRLKCTLQTWMQGLFTGPWDGTYYELRARIGRRHVEIDLPQHYMLTAMNVVRRHLVDLVVESRSDPGQRRAELHAIDKLLDMELAIMLHTYREDYVQRMQKNERLATYGQLVASIGHELRNPLGVMESSLFLLRNRVSQDEKVQRHLDRIEQQIRVSNRIISDMLDLVRDRPLRPEPVELRSLVAAAVESLEVPAGIELDVEVEASLPKVHVDPDQVRQVVINLLSNAFDAAGKEGKILVRGSLPAEEMVELLVNDSGPGIDPSVRSRLFEPLVTTKTRGIGLGLSLCKRIIEYNGGTIRVGAGPLPGAAFVVRLPVAGER